MYDPRVMFTGGVFTARIGWMPGGLMLLFDPILPTQVFEDVPRAYVSLVVCARTCPRIGGTWTMEAPGSVSC